jgi:hypothetical protein
MVPRPGTLSSSISSTRRFAPDSPGPSPWGSIAIASGGRLLEGARLDLGRHADPAVLSLDPRATISSGADAGLDELLPHQGRFVERRLGVVAQVLG